jgi:hypothetical protein
MRAIVATLLLCTLMIIAPCWAQDASRRGAQHPSAAAPPATPGEIELQKRIAKQRNQERFAQLKKDTDHLLELATQLKKSVDEATDQTLSLEVIRKAEQIEKLAKQVRQKMAAD